MHIKDHSAAMKFFRTYDNVASKGKWKEFVDEMEFDSMLQEPRTTAQEPRNMYAGGQLVQNTADGSRIEAEEAAASRSDMMKSHVKGFAEGQLVRNTVDGSRPGYGGKGSGMQKSEETIKFLDYAKKNKKTLKNKTVKEGRQLNASGGLAGMLGE